jgi:hypothetical protein
MRKKYVPPSFGRPGLGLPIEQFLKRQEATLLERIDTPEIRQAILTAKNLAEATPAGRLNQLEKGWGKTEQSIQYERNIVANEVSRRISIIRNQHTQFNEIIVITDLGTLIGQTGPSDHAVFHEEDWWLKAVQSTDPKETFGDIEFDSYRQKSVIPVYLKLTDPESGRLDAVIRAEVDVDYIKASL